MLSIDNLSFIVWIELFIYKGYVSTYYIHICNEISSGCSLEKLKTKQENFYDDFILLCWRLCSMLGLQVLGTEIAPNPILAPQLAPAHLLATHPDDVAPLISCTYSEVN